MQQRITHGGMIDTATPGEVAKIVQDAKDVHQDSHYRRLKGVINLDATGAGQGVEKAPRLYSLELQRITCTGVNALWVLYENQVQDSDQLEVIQLGAAGRYSDAFSNNLFIPAGSQCLFVVSGGPASGNVSYNIQARLLRVAA